jgi:pimeloyl-ACP methyl ester carboxylesterase
MRAFIESISGDKTVRELAALVVEPISNLATAPVLLFLHGKGEAGSSPNELPLVCIHQTPPFQAILGYLRGAIVIAPQAPPVPTKDDWNWRDHVRALAEFLLGDRFARRRIVATGFSRGGLGVLQLVSGYPELVDAWAVVDPQPPRDQAETNAILSSQAIGAQGWLRYGDIRNRNNAWRNFSSSLIAKLHHGDGDVTQLEHAELALQAYEGSRLSERPQRRNLYEFLGLEFESADRH